MRLIPYHDVSEVLIRSSEDPACLCGIAVGHRMSGLMSAVQFCRCLSDLAVITCTQVCLAYPHLDAVLNEYSKKQLA